MLPDWFRAAGRGRSRGRQPGQQRRIHAAAAPQSDSDSPRHRDPGPHRSDPCASANGDGHTGAHTNRDCIEHGVADALGDGNGKPNPNTRRAPVRYAVHHTLPDRHAPTNANGNADPQRDGPARDQHDGADRDAAAADSHTAGAHIDNGANADNCADESAAGVDLHP